MLSSMGVVLKDIAVDQIAEELKRRGYAADTRVSVTVGETIDELAKRISAEAAARGLTDEALAKLLKDE